ncbi:MAG: adenylosuccinate lyase [Candidatus Bipolaricaulia bacterium]
MPLTAISPLDGRYQGEVKELEPIFSESALMRYRIKVEVEYLIALSQEKQIDEIKKLTRSETEWLRNLCRKFSETDARRIKAIEKTTNHDVKSVEYFIKEKMRESPLQGIEEFVHFALTSEDVNNIAYSLMLQEGVAVYKKHVLKLLSKLKSFAVTYKSIPLLAMTHGQPATPTTVGKELAVFYFRIQQQLNRLETIRLSGKLSGASGNWNAHYVAYPKVDWFAFSRRFIESFGLEFHPLTTQIEPHDRLAAVYHAISRINSTIKDLDQDCWFYISRGIFKQKKIMGEVGSSTMPHKVNPIDFENSEGNIGLANSILCHLAEKLPISRLQRDLSDSTVLRNQGVALGYSLLAVKSTLRGLSKLEVNRQRAEQELEDHWEVLAEPIQTVLRKIGCEDSYEELKRLTRGQKVTKTQIQEFIRNLDIPKQEEDKLLRLSPKRYIGLASRLVDQYVK